MENSEETKKCLRCKVTKNIEEFHIDRSTKDGRCRLCRPCYAERRKEPDKRFRERNKEKVSQQKKDFQLMVHNYFNGSCYICKTKDDCAAMFHCHHVDSTKKKYQICHLALRKWDTVILPELKKCVYLCANCHIKLHAGAISLDQGEKK